VALREMGVEDLHVFTLEKHVRQLLKFSQH